MPLFKRDYVRRGGSAHEGRKDIRRSYPRYRIDRFKRAVGRWSRRLSLVALGAVLVLLVQGFWPGMIGGLTQGIKSGTQGFLDLFSTGGRIIQDYEKPASPNMAVPTPYLVTTPTPNHVVTTTAPVLLATPVRPRLEILERTPSPNPTPTSRPGNSPTPLVPREVTKEWIESAELEIHRLTNEERVQRSIRALSYDTSLASIAQGHSRDMAQLVYFEHDNLQGQSPTDRATQSGYRCRKDYRDYYTDGIAENIFQTSLYSSYTTSLGGLVVSRDYITVEDIATQILDGWMDSPGHRENILDASYGKEGIGVAVSSDEKVYVTQNFC